MCRDLHCFPIDDDTENLLKRRILAATVVVGIRGGVLWRTFLEWVPISVKFILASVCLLLARTFRSRL